MERTACQICGSSQGFAGTELCDGCWEVTRRIDDFLRHKNGKKHVLEALAKVDERFADLQDVGADEPIFILKARDNISPLAVETWAKAAMTLGAPEAVTAGAIKVADSMESWAKVHGSKVPS